MTNKYIEINPARIDYLLKLYKFSKDNLLGKLNDKRKTKLTREDIFDKNIKLSNLQKIDKIFDVGLSYYTNPQNPSKFKKTSIFFRKDKFNSKLTYPDRWRVNMIESELKHLNAIAKLSDYKISRTLRRYTIGDDCRKVANEVREILEFNADRGKQQSSKQVNVADKEFLKYFIQKLADVDVLVYEFVEQHNLKRKTVWDGMFLRENSIVIKRQQKALKREIFTLAHEFGHYLLDIEEIDDNPFKQSQADIEKWCNDFAFYFIIGEERENLLNLLKKEPQINNAEVFDLANQLHISRLAIYTHFVIHGDIDNKVYGKLCKDLDSIRRKQLDKEKRERELAKKNDSNAKTPAQLKPIFSPLEKDIYRHAYFAGTVEEIDIINRFNPNSRSIQAGFMDKLLYGV